MNNSYLYNRPNKKENRQRLRKLMTPAEIALWLLIKSRQIEGKRFVRQYSIGAFVVDFYCPECRLAIELDGEVHESEEARLYDAKRTEFLEKNDVKVLRFENFEVFNYPERTIEEIKNYLIR